MDIQTSLGCGKSGLDLVSDGLTRVVLAKWASGIETSRKTLTAPVRYGGVMRRYPPSLWDTVRAAIGCAAILAVLLLVGVVLYLIAPYIFGWMGYVTCYVQQLLGAECTPVLPTAIED
jgi:hypothetical protein